MPKHDDTQASPSPQYSDGLYRVMSAAYVVEAARVIRLAAGGGPTAVAGVILTWTAVNGVEFMKQVVSYMADEDRRGG